MAAKVEHSGRRRVEAAPYHAIIRASMGYCYTPQAHYRILADFGFSQIMAQTCFRSRDNKRGGKRR